MENSYEGYWYRSHKDSTSEWQCGLYKEDTYYQDNIYDDVGDDSHIDDRVATKKNEKLLSECEILKEIREFLEIGMKYKIKVRKEDTRYYLEINEIEG
ncbi:MAG: hypothetical protein GY941_02585 [Planctomycetes bacterium]|nr:hypothetical protein [Planctomycetota bacterium]